MISFTNKIPLNFKGTYNNLENDREHFEPIKKMFQDRDLDSFARRHRLNENRDDDFAKKKREIYYKNKAKKAYIETGLISLLILAGIISAPNINKNNKDNDNKDTTSISETQNPIDYQESEMPEISYQVIVPETEVSTDNTTSFFESESSEDLSSIESSEEVEEESLPESSEDLSSIESSEETEEILSSESQENEAYNEEIINAIEIIKSNPETQKVYSDILKTIKRMKSSINNPINTINELLSQEWVNGIDIELVLSQIFIESSGNHYNENGTIKTSSTNCVGFMQISKGSQTDTNNEFFQDNYQDRNDPIGNINLGIGYTQLLMNNYFGNNIFDTLCAYNVGQGNILAGNYLGSEKYASKILYYQEILKSNPDFTQMLLNGDFDEFETELEC